MKWSRLSVGSDKVAIIVEEVRAIKEKPHTLHQDKGKGTLRGQLQLHLLKAQCGEGQSHLKASHWASQCLNPEISSHSCQAGPPRGIVSHVQPASSSGKHHSCGSGGPGCLLSLVLVLKACHRRSKGILEAYIKMTESLRGQVMCSRSFSTGLCLKL